MKFSSFYKYTFYTLLLSLLSVQMGYAQNEFLYSNWVMDQIIGCDNKIVHPLAETYWDVTFRPNGYAAMNVSFKKVSIENPYTLEGKKLIFSYGVFDIEKISIDSLVISSSDNKCHKYLFLSEKAKKMKEERKKDILVKQNHKSFIYKNEKVFFANRHNAPKLAGFTDHNQFFYEHFPPVYKYDKCQMTFQFIIKKDGSILDPKGNIDCLKNSSRMVEKIIKKIENDWTPMYIDNEPVNALVRIKVKTMDRS